MPGLTRRIFMKASMAMLTLAALPRVLFAKEWPKDAFMAETADEALTALFGSSETTPSDAVKLGAPEIAENGAVVPVTVESSLSGATSVSLVVDNNPRPLAAHFELSGRVQPNIACRIKMGQTSRVLAVVRTDGGVFSAAKEVKVTIGGCGG